MVSRCDMGGGVLAGRGRAGGAILWSRMFDTVDTVVLYLVSDTILV